MTIRIKNRLRRNSKQVQQAYEQIMKEKRAGESITGIMAAIHTVVLADFPDRQTLAIRDEESMRRQAAANYIQSGHYH